MVYSPQAKDLCGIAHQLTCPFALTSCRSARAPASCARFTRLQLEIGAVRRAADHRRIVEAILAGDADTAESASVGHVGSLDRELGKLAAHPGPMTFVEAQVAPGGRSRLPSPAVS